MHVLITGAGGHLGRKLFDALEAKPGYAVSGIDIRPTDHPRIHTADLSSEPVWADLFEGVDVIVHLAGDREPGATWPSAIKNNMDATLTLYHHAAARGVKRVVLASSNWLHGDKRFTGDRLDSTTPPGPINAYGMSKLFCERTGAYFAEHHGLSVICLRIGWTQWTHDNRPGPHMAMGRWGQEMWLSDRDFLSGMQAAIEAADVDFAVLNLMSDNPGMRWDISETRRVIGYEPEDGSPAKITMAIRLTSALKKLVTVTLPNAIDKRHPDW
ncbi:NAD(P)-dependent oxidoreductase [Oceaniradius stylonematis]|jgi:nucleoside-diphosphate-sugar epimerase|uniref:NAD(P)-dependent oxidoreductase n=1 Tax=Oceaniradius stylonematis TaxID=2184161 RepID=A0A3A8AE81_9HYPH|nr:NAD(P)-dependent oxidoreductase [Oceaniradius stylonematis]RKF07678.1 NAD(P)-dependent oxidoreductase [Oceaniradius stylonematis]